MSYIDSEVIAWGLLTAFALVPCLAVACMVKYLRRRQP